jgi:hypothetical protein
VQAYNVSRASENKIHDDSVARKFGFSGGLVPGAEVYAYMTHLPVQRWGRAWLEHGAAECRFLKPVYDGNVAAVTAEESEGALQIRVESEGELCATGSATLPAASKDGPQHDTFPQTPPTAVRPPADEASLAEGTQLGTVRLSLTPAFCAQYLDDVRETEALYANNGLAHPALVLRLCNAALRENVVLGPWIHTGSSLQNLAALHVRDELSARARVVANYERKGHRLVDIDVLVLANGQPAARVMHTAIYRLRQAAPNLV